MNFSPLRFSFYTCEDMPDTGRSKLRKFLICWLPLIIYCLAIYIQSGRSSPERLPDVQFLDKILHFVAYGLLGVLFFRAYLTLPLKDSKNLLILISIGSATLYGVSDEIHQYFVPFREADLMDGVANMIGSICGVYFYFLWKVHKKPA
ncbi:MAG: VanZ family protein [Desulfobacterales bacterium]|jgi:VanZ family protein